MATQYIPLPTARAPRLPLTSYVTLAIVRFHMGHDFRKQAPRWYRAMAIRLHVAATTYDTRGDFATARECRALLTTCERYAAR